jgi:hypothetical protein
VGRVGCWGGGGGGGGAPPTSRRGSAARRGLRQSRKETAAVSQARDDLVDQQETARADAASAPANPVPSGDRPLSSETSRRSGLHLFGRRPASPKAAATRSDSAAGEAAPDIPADATAPAE